MSGTKRTGVPPVAKPRVENPLIPEKTVPEPKPVSDILEDVPRTKNTGYDETRTNERKVSVNPIKTAIAAVKNNKTAIAQKAMVAAGAAVGMLITSTLVDRLGDRRPDVEVIVINDTADKDLSDVDPTDPTI